MSLSTLSTLSPAAALSVIAAAVQLVGPNAEEPPEAIRDQVRDLLAELRASTPAIKDTTSPAGDANLNQALSDAIDDVVFADGSEKETKERLANADHLPLGGLNISFLFNTSVMKAENKKSLIRCILDNDVVQPLTWANGGLPGPTTGYIYAKFIERQGKKSHWLCVNTKRSGLDMQVNGAWRMFEGVVDYESAKTPIELMKRFAETYGVSMSPVAHHPFVQNTEVPFETVAERKQRAFKVLDNKGTLYEEQCSHNETNSQTFIYYAMLIDAKRYLRDFRRYI